MIVYRPHMPPAPPLLPGATEDEKLAHDIYEDKRKRRMRSDLLMFWLEFAAFFVAPMITLPMVAYAAWRWLEIVLAG